NGDGTFQLPIPLGVTNPGSLVAMDANGDGKLDLVAGDDRGNVSLLLGNGNGTFQSAINSSAYPFAMAVGDFNGDRAPDLIFSNGSSISLGVFLNTGGAALSTTSSANPSHLGQSVTFTTTLAPTFSFIGTPSGTITFKDGNQTLGKVNLSGGQASLTTSSLTLGKHKILTSYSGDSNFNPNQASVLKQKVIR